MTSQAARDLIWAINSPSLIRPTSNCSTDWPICRAADFDPSELQRFCDQNMQYRVGRYFENLVHFHLETVRRNQIVERGLQIQEDGRTIGELDFIYRDDEGTLRHCETAVKFYLYVAESNDSGSHLVGPNAADNFERKMRRLFEHQLTLGQRNFPNVTTREAFVKGRIFYHPQNSEPEEFPDLLAPDHLKGVWIRESELELLRESDSVTKFRIARKPHWLAPDQADFDDSNLQTADEILSRLTKHFAERRTPQLVNALSQGDEFWHESHRVFVVSDQWPNDAL
jgi:hypothetical protein